MASEQPSLHEKIAYFAQLTALEDDTDGFDALEEQDRLLRARFFHTRSMLPRPQVCEGTTVRENKRLRNQMKTSERRHISEETIRATPQNSRCSRIVDLLGKGDSIIPDSTRPRWDNVSLLKRPEMTDSPSMGSKKRRQDSLKLRPEQEQLFKDLSFYYIPNNDIAPVRRLRINKAREYGASWVPDVVSATHVIVDKGIQYKDVEKAISGKKVKVVSEDYPIDCIRFRAILGASQKKYMVPGQPDQEGGQGEGLGPPSSEKSSNSLRIKAQHRNSRKRDFVPKLGTPSRSVDGTPLVEDSPRVTPVNVDGTREVSQEKVEEKFEGLGGNPEQVMSNVEDELSQYILMMQDLKDLPLDNDDEVFPSATDGIEACSDRGQDRGSSQDEPQETSLVKKHGFGSKHTPFEDRFACNQAGAQDAYRNNPNSRTIEVLQSMANYYDRVNDHWRTTGYRKAITTLKRQASRITTEEEAYQLPHIGRRIAQKIEEIATTNRLQRLEYVQDDPADDALQVFLHIYGVGSKQAQQWVSQGHRTLEDIKSKAKLNPSQWIGVEHFDDLNTKIPRCEVEALGTCVRKAAARIDSQVELIIGGSYRRGSTSSNDIDLIVTKPETESAAQLRPFLHELLRVLERDGFVTAHLASFNGSGGGSIWHGCCVLPKTKGIKDADYRPIWRRIDLLLVPAAEMGGALIYFTGNDIFNRSLRLLASKKGMRLNQRGLYRRGPGGPDRACVTAGELLEGRDERRIFEILGVKWREPHERWC
ncbi:hypothetical protein ED733_006547 [Metarhizium rileyi]|uniref:DNA polymerase lambda n=1 Tax=Metarhizium rileyi (strain RCEF 4871) TaxID=1649241 RepID=A0A5C6GEG0_METRR|nr:hypothetical protein ED733_006547 [Metarhizium rileyi]